MLAYYPGLLSYVFVARAESLAEINSGSERFFRRSYIRRCELPIHRQVATNGPPTPLPKATHSSVINRIKHSFGCVKHTHFQGESHGTT